MDQLLNPHGSSMPSDGCGPWESVGEPIHPLLAAATQSQQHPTNLPPAGWGLAGPFSPHFPSLRKTELLFELL